jgi:hypothetical protein
MSPSTQSARSLTVKRDTRFCDACRLSLGKGGIKVILQEILGKREAWNKKSPAQKGEAFLFDAWQ